MRSLRNLDTIEAMFPKGATAVVHDGMYADTLPDFPGLMLTGVSGVVTLNGKTIATFQIVEEEQPIAVLGPNDREGDYEPVALLGINVAGPGVYCSAGEEPEPLERYAHEHAHCGYVVADAYAGAVDALIASMKGERA